MPFLQLEHRIVPKQNKFLITLELGRSLEP